MLLARFMFRQLYYIVDYLNQARYLSIIVEVPGIEPATSSLVVRHAKHSAYEPCTYFRII